MAVSAVAFTGCAASDSEFQAQSRTRLAEDVLAGYENWYATTCNQCGGGCGVIVRIIEGRAKKVEGNPADPVSRGKLCARGQAAVQAQYNPDRLRGPMAITGVRGSGRFGPSGWDSGLDQVRKRLSDLRDAGKARAVVLITRPLRGHRALIAQRFSQAYGARWLQLEAIGEAPLRAAVKQVFGTDQLPEWDIQNAQYVLNFGSDFLMTGPQPVHYGVQYGIFRQGNYSVGADFKPQARTRGHMVQVESRFSGTGASADDWLAARPGTEGVLALSIAQAIVSGGLGVSGGEAIYGGRSALDQFAPEKVASQTGISAARIHSVAHDFATRRPSLAMAGGQAGAYTNGTEAIAAALGLNVLMGNVGQRGGVLLNPPSPIPGVPNNSQPNSLSDWINLANELRAGQIEAVLVHEANPVFELPGALNFHDALLKAPFVASLSSFMDETSALADVILPSSLTLEDWGDDLPESGPGYPVVHIQQPVVRPFYDTRSAWDTLLTLGDELGLAQSLPWPTFKDAVMDTARSLQKLSRGSVQNADFDHFWNELRQKGGWFDATGVGSQESGAGGGQAPVVIGAAQFVGSAGEYPFHLVVFPSNSLDRGQAANLPWMQAAPDPVTTAVWQSWVEVNPGAAAGMGLREGDVVTIESPNGKVDVPVYISPATPPDVLAIPLGQGHTQYGRYAQQRGVNPMYLLAPVVDQTSGALAYASTRVRMTKAGRSSQFAKFEGDIPAYQIPGQEVAKVVYGAK